MELLFNEGDKVRLTDTMPNRRGGVVGELGRVAQVDPYDRITTYLVELGNGADRWTADEDLEPWVQVPAAAQLAATMTELSKAAALAAAALSAFTEANEEKS
jgi:hypothetical protein